MGTPGEGSRLDSGLCLLCGTVLLHPFNDFQTCSKCTKHIQQQLYKAEKIKRKTNPNKKKTGSIVDKRMVVLQPGPRGQTVD